MDGNMNENMDGKINENMDGNIDGNIINIDGNIINENTDGNMDGNRKNKVLIIDGHGLAFRAFYAVSPLSAPDGTPTNAILGFMNMLAKVESDISPGTALLSLTLPAPPSATSYIKNTKRAANRLPRNSNCRSLC